MRYTSIKYSRVREKATTVQLVRLPAFIDTKVASLCFQHPPTEPCLNHVNSVKSHL